jgi:hypothetical protein
MVDALHLGLDKNSPGWANSHKEQESKQGAAGT